MSNKPVVIIGAGHAGVTMAVKLIELKWPGEIVLIDSQNSAPYERPPLSKDLLKVDSDSKAPLLRRTEWFADKGITRIAGQSVTWIDREHEAVELSDGSVQPYHRLVIATGANARPLPARGTDLPGVQMLKTESDALQLRETLVAGKKIVIVGAGYIGMEVAAAAATAGCDTTVVELQDRIMARVTSSPVSHYFEGLHQQAGTVFHFGAGVNEIYGDDRVEGVLTDTGENLAADHVVVGIGVTPNQQLAEQADLDCGDGIIIDQSCRTSDPHIYAIGDVTRSLCPIENTRRRLECIQNATHQATQAARNILGLDQSKLEVPWFWTVQHGKRLQTAGVRRPDDDIIVRGSLDSGKFSVLYLRRGRLAAIDTIGSLADFKQAKKLIAAQHLIDPESAVDQDLPLTNSALIPAYS